MAYADFKYIMEKEPENKEVNMDLKECFNKMNKEGGKDKGFKRV